MQAIEMTGKSLDEAKKAAASKLGVSPDELSVTVLEETKGLFGKSNVRIRAEVSNGAKAAAPAAKPEKPARAAKPAPAPEPMEDVQEAFEEAPPAEVKAEKPRRGRGKPAPAEAAAEPA